MDKSTISRGDLKKNFLKEIIMRLDFQGVLQAEMESILLEAKPFLKAKNFNRYEEQITNKLTNSFTGELADIQSQIIYVFTSEAQGYVVKLSNTSIILSVHSQGYSPFNEYSEVFCGLAKIYSEKIDFFTVKRLGVRKINSCCLRDRNDIAKYFNTSFFNDAVPADGFLPLKIERKDRLVKDTQNINMRYTIEQGKLKDDLIHQVTLDSDIYVVSQNEIERLLFSETAISEINETLFRIFINSISEALLEILSSESDDVPDGLEGVESNE